MQRDGISRTSGHCEISDKLKMKRIEVKRVLCSVPKRRRVPFTRLTSVVSEPFSDEKLRFCRDEERCAWETANYRYHVYSIALYTGWVESRKFLRLAFPAPPSCIVCSAELCTFMRRRLNWRTDENPGGEQDIERIRQTDRCTNLVNGSFTQKGRGGGGDSA